jgi:short-subunit dehydrogenase
MLKFNNILITGASSGIGRALAIDLAKNCQNLFLCARNLTNLEQTRNLCQADQNAKSPTSIHLKVLDVKDQQACQSYIDEIEKNYQLDLIIANAGISAGTANGLESIDQIKQIFDTNLYGVINIIQPGISYMKNRKHGQIAIISSLAGFIALPSSPAYSASKSAVRIYGEALRVNLSNYNIKVNVICPGYVKTPMTAVNNFYMPLIINSSKASKKIIFGIENNKPLIIFPLALYLIIMLSLALPRFIVDKIFKKLPKKSTLKS